MGEGMKVLMAKVEKSQSDHDSEARFGIYGQKWSRNDLGKF